MPKPGDVLANLSVQTQLGFAQPERHRKAGFDWQRDGHFNETAAHAQIRGLAHMTGWPGGCSSTETEHFIRGERRRSTAERKLSTAIP